MKANLLYISPDLNYACGVSKHVYINLKNLSRYSDYKLFFITNKGDSLDRLKNISKLNYSIFDFEKDHKNLFRLTKDFFHLLLYCKKYKIDIIHTHHRYPELLSVLVSKFTAVKTITTVHSFVHGLKTLSFRSDKIITVSKAVEEHLYKNYPHAKGRCKNIYNCIDESYYKPGEIDTHELKKSLGYTDSNKIILFVGRISRIKGVDTLINAFIKINRTNEHIKLILLGQVEDINILGAIKGFEKQILVIQPTENISVFYEVSDIVVLPSRIDPFPYVMLEAGAKKKPFIGGNTGGIAEFIEDGVCGLLIEPGDSDKLADKIIFLINNPAQSELIANALYEKVKQECDGVQYFERLHNIYKQLRD
ncbi:MAG: glycosyltransferase family 1 protein [Ignavibacteriales bacterium]|nr:MAG: glycosyltransferase family 1 protein [Ignavibacteriales bacterium]